MTNTTTISDQTDQFVTEANRLAINTLPKPLAIASYIDLPISLLLLLDPLKSLKTVAAATATYQIRSNINYYLKSEEFNDYLKDKTGGAVNIKYITETTADLVGLEPKYVIGATAGLVGGAFKYYVTGQNPVIGALNNIAYETCNNIDLCANNKAVNIVFSITVETLDAATQTALKLGTGNVLGAMYSTVTGGATVIEKLKAAQDLFKASGTGNISSKTQQELQKILGKKISITDTLTKMFEGSSADFITKITSLAAEKSSKTTEFLLAESTKAASKAMHDSIKGGVLVGSLIGMTGNFGYGPALDLKVKDPSFYNYSVDALDYLLDTVGNYLFSPGDFHNEF